MHTLEHRVPPPIVFIILAAAMRAGSRGAPPWPRGSGLGWIVADVFAWLALILATLGFISFRLARTTIDPIHIEAASTLVTTGVYKFTRNPMYLGLTCLLLAWSVYLMVPWTLLGPLAFVFFTTRFQIIPEERVLQCKFGQAYRDYLSQVRRWL